MTSAPAKHCLFPPEPDLYPDPLAFRSTGYRRERPVWRVAWQTDEDRAREKAALAERPGELDQDGHYYSEEYSAAPGGAPDDWWFRRLTDKQLLAQINRERRAGETCALAQRKARLVREKWRAVCRALGIRDPEPVGHPVGLCGKYYGEYSPPRLAGRLRLPQHEPQRKRRAGSGWRIVIPERWSAKRKNVPVMHRWTIERLPERSESAVVEWMLRLAHSTRRPITTCMAYAVMLKRESFTIRDGRPVSTYVAYKRLKGGRLFPAIEDAEDGRLGLLLAADDLTLDHLVKLPLADELPEDDQVWVSDELLSPSTESLAFVDSTDPNLARDMGTRYAWQMPSAALESSRDAAWREFADGAFPSLKRKFARGAPPQPADPEFYAAARDAVRQYYGDWGIAYQARSHSYAATLGEMADRFNISPAKAKRALASAKISREFPKT